MGNRKERVKCDADCRWTCKQLKYPHCHEKVERVKTMESSYNEYIALKDFKTKVEQIIAHNSNNTPDSRKVYKIRNILDELSKIS